MENNMKQVVQNKYLKGFSFSSSEEALTFYNNQKADHSLSIEDTFGDNYYCYVCYHSLTNDKLFVLSFSSDEREDNLNFLYWNNLVVLDTGKSIYLIDEAVKIKVSLEVTTPLVGLYVINDEKLLVLEEAFIRVINYKGEVVKSEQTDLIEDFSIKGKLLHIRTDGGNKIIELI
ncbi:hypothetical protein GCM10023231_17060 [Olivibacter ginsenosidimutans]|uniref:Uncharacterized protein n=1 Tax=Olivibacter ginsenosidimutans TaxID=1176537 RepID=A0ABP9B404_9SPHI